MKHLREEVVQHMSADIVMNFVEDTVVSVNGGQAAPQVAPLLHMQCTHEYQTHTKLILKSILKYSCMGTHTLLTPVAVVVTAALA